MKILLQCTQQHRLMMSLMKRRKRRRAISLITYAQYVLVDGWLVGKEKERILRKGGGVKSTAAGALDQIGSLFLMCVSVCVYIL
jgi:hypothetical protein